MVTGKVTGNGTSKGSGSGIGTGIGNGTYSVAVMYDTSMNTGEVTAARFLAIDIISELWRG